MHVSSFLWRALGGRDEVHGDFAGLLELDVSSYAVHGFAVVSDLVVGEAEGGGAFNCD
jgi:hypothetical protein